MVFAFMAQSIALSILYLARQNNVATLNGLLYGTVIEIKNNLQTTSIYQSIFCFHPLSNRFDIVTSSNRFGRS